MMGVLREREGRWFQRRVERRYGSRRPLLLCRLKWTLLGLRACVRSRRRRRPVGDMRPYVRTTQDHPPYHVTIQAFMTSHSVPIPHVQQQ